MGRIPQRSRTEKRVLFQAGQRYTDIVQSILLELGISRIIAIQSDATLKNDRADWEIGTSWIKIINSLLAEINYQSLWFDTEGNARIRLTDRLMGRSSTTDMRVGSCLKLSHRSTSAAIFTRLTMFLLRWFLLRNMRNP